jgi:hypothetical protein
MLRQPSSGCSDPITTATSQEDAMAKVGPFITEPNAGAYCQITLDSGEKLIVNHDKGGFKGGRITIELSKFMGFSSQRIFSCDLDSPVGKAALAQLTREARPGSVEATPLGAVVECVKHCASVADVKTRCGALPSQ